MPDQRLKQAKIAVPPPERRPSVAIYHPDATKLFESYDAYEKWYLKRPKSKVQSPKSADLASEPATLVLDPESTIGLLLMRPQVISKTTKHYDALIRAIEAEGLSVIPALSTLMDNREAVSKFFIDQSQSKVQSPKSKVKEQSTKNKDQKPPTGQRTTDHAPLTTDQSRVSQIVSLTGFSFVGGPAMNDSEAAADFLKELNRPYRSAVSLDTQTIDAWRESQTGLNPVQAGMQIAIPEIDGATEPFIYGGIPRPGARAGSARRSLRQICAAAPAVEPFAHRAAQRNQTGTDSFCFPPNKGNIGTAADLDVFPSLWDTLKQLRTEGYDVELPASADALREMLIGGNSSTSAPLPTSPIA